MLNLSRILSFGLMMHVSFCLLHLVSLEHCSM